MIEIEDTSMYAGVVYGFHNGDYNYRYIGQTKQKLAYRVSQHKWRASTGHRLPVYDWIRKYGVENIHVCVIATFDEDTIHLIDEVEIAQIAQTENALNATTGGTSGAVISEEGRAKLRAARLGTTHSEETKRKIGESSKLRKHTDERKQKMSVMFSGEGNPMFGKTASTETRAKLSEAHKGAFPEGMHVRWHVNRGVVNEECPRCQQDAK